MLRTRTDYDWRQIFTIMSTADLITGSHIKSGKPRSFSAIIPGKPRSSEKSQTLNTADENYNLI